MKYQNLKSFQKHLRDSSPHHLCHHYLVQIADEYERNVVLDNILSYLPPAPTRFLGGDFQLKEFFDTAFNLTLFGDVPVVLLDEVEKVAKKDLERLAGSLSSFPGYTILGSRSKTSLLASVEKEGVVLDLLEEKPWEKDKRLSEQLIERAKNAGKKISSDAIACLIERVGNDAAQQVSEMDKLICFTGHRMAITKDDVLQITAANQSLTLWQIAEEVVWEGKEFPSLDGASFHTLIPALRYQLHIGLMIATLIEENKPVQVPKVWPKTIEKLKPLAHRYGSSYFRKGLNQLFEIELLSRTDSSQYTSLLELIRVR